MGTDLKRAGDLGGLFNSVGLPASSFRTDDAGYKKYKTQ
jgi:hypothetical protein